MAMGEEISVSHEDRRNEEAMTPKVKKGEKCWAIFGDGGFIFPSTVRATRRQAIDRFIEIKKLSWYSGKVLGYSCRKVTVVEGWPK